MLTSIPAGLSAWRRHTVTATSVLLADGSIARLRDAHDDEERLHALFYTLSDTTRYLYFCAGVPQNSIWAERVAQLGHVDGAGQYALVAEVDGVVVGVARFDRAEHDDRAEIGILVTDAWQRRGLGRAALSFLRAEAVRRGLAGFTATTLGDNRRATRLLMRAFPWARSEWAAGQATFDLPFTPPCA